MQKQSKNGELFRIPLDDTERFFYSHDIGLVGYLLCEKFKMVGLDKGVTNKVLFVLERDAKMHDAIMDYWNFKSSVDAQTYFNQIKRLKNQIFSSE